MKISKEKKDGPRKEIFINQEEANNCSQFMKFTDPEKYGSKTVKPIRRDKKDEANQG